jgi:site-specific DNA-methyltransferase (adenine-specific)
MSTYRSDQPVPKAVSSKERGAATLQTHGFDPSDGLLSEGADVIQPSRIAYADEKQGLYVFHGDCLEVMDAMCAKHPGGCFDLIFADPPYFLSNGGVTCHAGRMVKVDKGDWDKSRGAEENHNFNREWLKRCQSLLKPNGTIFVSGTHHVIFSVGYAMQQLGMKVLNQITWQKPNPPPNLACRYFTHSTETVLWAAKNERTRHVFNYADMKRENSGKQMKDVWSFTAPKGQEKRLGKHPTQKPLVLLNRLIRASSKEGDWVLDPFLGSGTTAIACALLGRKCVGIESDVGHVSLASSRLRETTQARMVQDELEVSYAGTGTSGK